MANSGLVSGEFVLQDLFNEFTYQVNKKIDVLLSDPHFYVSIISRYSRIWLIAYRIIA